MAASENELTSVLTTSRRSLNSFGGYDMPSLSIADAHGVALGSALAEFSLRP